MMNAASTSNSSFIVDVGEAYPYPSHVSTPNFLTIKLSGKDTYDVWQTQVVCLLKSHRMFGFVEGQFPRPENWEREMGDIDMDAWIASDSLIKGWILGSLSDGVAKKVVRRLKPKHTNTDFTAKDVWDELQRSYGPWVGKQPARVLRKLEEFPPGELLRNEETDSLTKEKKTRKERINMYRCFTRKWLYNAILEGNTRSVLFKLEAQNLNPWDQLMDNGNTILHVAVSSTSTKKHELLKKLLEMTPKENTLLALENIDGNTLLHLAAIGGNIEAVNMLVERNPELLLAKNKEGHTPLALSVSNVHTKTSHCLFEHMKENGYNDYFSQKTLQDLIVVAISCQDFSLANKMIGDYGVNFKDEDAVMMALAQNFPRELRFWERRGLPEIERLINPLYTRLDEYSVGFNWLYSSSRLILLPVWFYYILKVLVRPFLGDTVHLRKDAITLLRSLCLKMTNHATTNHRSYTSPIFEATRRNASIFIRCIMWNFPDAIWSTNEDGHNFIQYSAINRSEKIYNLLYEMSEHKNIYKTIKDSFGNNLLHLAARLAPANKLNLISGACLQIQRELQWFKEVEQFVCPLNRIQKNLDDETPEMVFTREHKDLVIEGENWIKKTAESYTITAALIITIVFAAAITVPGGNNEKSGMPVFTNNTAFKVFAISDAISLFTAVTSLLMFLSILTARFAEQDFLYKLPTKLIIGLTMLFLSTTAMIIAFGATLFLVFGQSNMLTLIPIGVLTCLPITSFVTLQFPLIVELVRATYGGGIFFRERDEYFY